MHEFSIVNQAVEKIMQDALDRGAKKIQKVEILLGELSPLGKEQFEFWMKQILDSKGEIARDTEIEVKTVKKTKDCLLKRIHLET